MLQSNGFFSKDNKRGEMPEDWAAKKTDGDAVMLCQIYAPDGKGGFSAKNSEGQKMKTFADGVERLELNVDPGDGQEQAKDNMRQYLYLMGKYGGEQKLLEDKYTGKKKTKDKCIYVYAPRKPMPFKVSYPAIGNPVKRSFNNFALHHNISFEQLKVFWNFAMAYAKKTSDRKPIIEMMMHLFDIPRQRAKNWTIKFVADGVSPGNEAIETLFNRVTWRGWNLVEGPASDMRHDDPGTRFDDFDVTTMPPERLLRIRAVKGLNTVVENVSNLMKKDGILSNEVDVDVKEAKFDDRYKLVVGNMRAALRSVGAFKNEDFIAFNPRMWIYKPKGTEWRFEVRRP